MKAHTKTFKIQEKRDVQHMHKKTITRGKLRNTCIISDVNNVNAANH